MGSGIVAHRVPLRLTSKRAAGLRSLIVRSSVSFSLMTLTFVTTLLIDGIVVGRFLGSNAMASYGLANPFVTLIMGLAMLVSGGFQAACIETLSRGNVRDANSLFTRAILVGLVMGAVITVICLPLSGLIASISGAASDLHADTQAFIVGQLVGVIGLFTEMTLLNFINLEGDRTYAYIGTILMAVVDITGNFLSVVVFDAGMLGIGLSTSISYYVGIIPLAMHFFSKKTILRFSLKDLEWEGTLHALHAGLLAIVGKFTSVVFVFVFNMILLSAGGNNAVAAFSIFLSWEVMVLIGESGIAVAVSVFCSAFSGEKNRLSLAYTFKYGLLLGFIANAIGMVITFIGAPIVVNIFLVDPDPAVASLATNALRILSLSFLSGALIEIYQKYLAGINKVFLAGVLGVIVLICELVFAVALGEAFGLDGIWASLFIAQLVAFIIMPIIAILNRESVLFIHDELDVPDGAHLEYQVTKKDDIVAASVAVDGYCKSHCVNKKNTYLLSLCVEEFARNAVEHGFKGKRDRQMNVRLVIDDDSLVLRIRDNCPRFNPQQYFELLSPEDGFSNIGIRMVFSLARDIKYIPLLRMNYIILTLPHAVECIEEQSALD